ncbi:T9SS type A sorting domain-containing protein [Flavobacteriaceae bacterium]|nr:T9SS type A sorting domain-containing protein [Flavobacteriaceae bacterium]MDA9373629.1 T9SS type A sorting domain-containing protein [Flavobacteriaceae bacterium]MDC1273886.1 T9SS type A sorting domain-containing protein [Flavobacteriaceae bacterium]MDC1335941.1 T9SS type A sorting domain-containing protein [Flavobacteriaceae bacterium]MDC1460033.1 T9SS type A sorting domain-containing protein [Flavobacteriaceae bacterium]
MNFSQNSIVSSGASVEASEGSFSYTVGQILTSQNLNSSSSVLNDIKELSHGVQQVFLQKCNENSGVEILATPNPSNGQVTINLKNWDEKKIDLNVFDMMGKNVLFTNISADKTKLDLSYLSSGAYIISLGYSCGSINSFKLLINKK